MFSHEPPDYRPEVAEEGQRIGHPLRSANRLCRFRLEGCLPECLPEDLAAPSSAGL